MMGATTQGKRPFIIAHFDGHGVCVGAARARTLGLAPEDVYAKFPVTGPEQLASYIDTFFPTLVQRTVEIVDIPVDLKNPAQYIAAVNRLAMNTPTVLWDHHATDRQYVTQLLARAVLFANATDMAEALADEANRTLAYIGAVCDRDPTLLSRVGREEIETALLPLANRVDVLVRQDAEATVKRLVSEVDPIAFLRAAAVDYPPERLAHQAAILRRGINTVLVDLTPIAQQSQWSWKVLEQIALRTGADYVVAVASLYDRATNQYVPGVQVIKYWLSQRPSPRPTLAPVLGRQTIGHDDAFSIRALDASDARQLAELMFNHLETLTPKTATLIADERVAQAVRHDFNAILTMLTQILQRQTEMYEQYLELKRQQVELLRQSSARERRYD